MGHLNAEAMAKLLNNPKDEAELYAHLADGCDECEAYLATAGHPLLDGATDAALLALAPAPAAGEAQDPRAEATFRKVRPALPSRRWLVALAAMLLAVVAMFLLRQRDAGDELGLKGPSRLTLELQAVVKGPTGALTRVSPGQSVTREGTLLLRYHASDATPATLVAVRDGQREVLGTFQLESGTHDLTRDGELAGLSLLSEPRGALVIRLEAVESAAQLVLNVE